MILLESIMHEAVLPAYALLPPKMSSPAASVMVLAIGLQESDFMYRRQLGNGPAVSFWQMEEGGGVHGVMFHPATHAFARHVAAARGVSWDQHAIYERLKSDDALGAAWARLLLYTDRAPLPGVHAEPEEAWQYYKRNWKPGKPHREKWDACHLAAIHQIVGDPDAH